MPQEQGILNIYKRPGKTPLECLTRFKEANPEYANVPMTYVGRLDPLADGVLIVLAGEARFRREEFLKLDKTYEFDVLWGFSSDSNDALGIAQFGSLPPDDIVGKLATILPEFRGEIGLPYPKYSSRTVEGVPLWKLSREGKLENVEMPVRRVRISKLEIMATRSLSGSEVLQVALEKISSVQGDFRQAAAAVSWKEILDGRKNASFPVTTFTAEVSSGTYMRTLADRLGAKLGCGGIAWKITRSAVGTFKIADSAL